MRRKDCSREKDTKENGGQEILLKTETHKTQPAQDQQQQGLPIHLKIHERHPLKTNHWQKPKEKRREESYPALEAYYDMISIDEHGKFINNNREMQKVELFLFNLKMFSQ